MAPRPKITPISPPTPPQPPAAPRPPSSPVADPTELARNLAQMLHDGKRDLVLQKVDDLAPAGRDVLERAMIGALSKDKNKDQAIELRRIIRFSRHRPTPPPNGGDFSAEKGNTIKWKIGNKERDKVDVDTGGTVTFRTNAIVDAGSAGKSKEAYWLTYQGPEAADMRWLQFFWRMVVAEFPLKGGKTRTTPVKMRLDNKGGVPYHLTTDEKKPQWTVDSTKKDRPFYDEAAKRSSFTIEMIDFPSAMPTNAMAADYFTRLTSPTGEKLTSAPKNVVAHFYAKTYLIHGMDVLYRADIHLKWTFTSPTTPAVEVALAQGVPTKELESAHRACLALQYPDVDYLPGRPIEAPQPMDDFDPVPDLAPMNWDNKTKTDLERYADIAALAHAEWINDVNPLTMSKDFIPRRVTDVTPGAVGMDPGLNYSAHFPEPGQTGYIDANKVYHNPDFPGDRDGPLPKIAIKLGETAFKLGKVRDKAFALGTMRHEMKHAAHEQLAIGWLMKWRDELTETPFKNWLEGERKKKHITELDFALVSVVPLPPRKYSPGPRASSPRYSFCRQSPSSKSIC